MKMKHVISMVLIVTFLFVVGIFGLEAQAAVLTGAAAGWVGILSAWLGLDIAVLHDKTVATPKGKFEDMKWTRYFFALLSMVALYCVALKVGQGQAAGAKAVLVPGILAMVGLFVGAYGVNKKATLEGPDE